MVLPDDKALNVDHGPGLETVARAVVISGYSIYTMVCKGSREKVLFLVPPPLALSGHIFELIFLKLKTSYFF